MQIWSNQEWTKVINVSRTKTDKSLKFYLSYGKKPGEAFAKNMSSDENIEIIIKLKKNVIDIINDNFGNDKIDAIRNFRSGFLLKMGIKPTLVESQIHNKICESTQKINNDDLVKIKNWLMKLTEFNKEREIFKTSSFEDILGEKWIYSSLRAESLTYEEKLKIIPEFPIFINSLDYIAKKLLLKKYYDFFSNIHHSVLE